MNSVTTLTNAQHAQWREQNNFILQMHALIDSGVYIICTIHYSFCILYSRISVVEIKWFTRLLYFAVTLHPLIRSISCNRLNCNLVNPIICNAGHVQFYVV